MRITSETSSGGVTEQLLALGELPGVLWTPDGAEGPRPLILMGHGGGQHKKPPDIAAHARRFGRGRLRGRGARRAGHGGRPRDEKDARIAAENQARVDGGADRAPLIAAFQALVADQVVPEWQRALDAIQELDYVGAGPAGYWGVSLGCGLGVPFVAADTTRPPSGPAESNPVTPYPSGNSWHVQYECAINRTEISWIGGDNAQVPLPRAQGNRDIDHIGVARPAAEQADSAGDRVVQGDDLGALVPEQDGDTRLPRSATPRLGDGTSRHRNVPVTPVDLFQQRLHPPAATLDRDKRACVEGDRTCHSTPSTCRAHA
jgi:hypothetical protein